MINVSGSAFLDLFAGTGAVGCEAASRSASQVTLVENSVKALEIIKKNCAVLKGALPEEMKIEICKTDVMKFAASKSLQTKYDWIFCDPPYGWARSEKLISRIVKSALLTQGGTLIWEASKRSIPDTDFEPVKQKRYGDTILLFYEQINLPQRTQRSQSKSKS